jgi:hypothetical protein
LGLRAGQKTQTGMVVVHTYENNGKNKQRKKKHTHKKQVPHKKQ